VPIQRRRRARTLSGRAVSIPKNPVTSVLQHPDNWTRCCLSESSLPRRPRRQGRQGRELRGPARRRRSGGARAPLQHRRHRRDRDPRRHRHGRGRQARAHTIAAVAREIFLPLAVGGGIRSEDDAAAAIEAGADKVSLNTAAIGNPGLITTLAKRYGSQAVIVAIDAKLQGARFAVYGRSGQSETPRDAVEWAREATARGAGEILLTSIDRDGTKAGFDCALTAAVSDAVNIPVIASGGAGSFEHLPRCSPPAEPTPPSPRRSFTSTRRA
jgi:tRNA-dihydrouridine synthase